MTPTPATSGIHVRRAAHNRHVALRARQIVELLATCRLLSFALTARLPGRSVLGSHAASAARRGRDLTQGRAWSAPSNGGGSAAATAGAPCTPPRSSGP